MSDDAFKDKKNIFRSIDELVFNLVDQIQISQPYQDFLESLQSLDSDLRNLLGKLGTFLLIIFPIVTCGSLFLINSSLSSRIEEMESSTKQADEYIIKAKKFTGATLNILGLSTYRSGKDMLTAIQDQAQAINVDGSTVSIANFNQSDVVSGILQTQATLQFSKISLENLSNLLERLSTRSKFRFDGLTIKKEKKNGSLEGKVEIIYFSKTVEQQ